MRRFILMVLFCTILMPAFAIGKLEDVVYTRTDSMEVENLLRQAKKTAPQNKILYFANHFMGRPYVGGTLDRGQNERLVVNLRELDCTTFVEQVIALAMCAERKETSFLSFCEHLRHVRYVRGNVSYVHRQHYFTLWINDNVAEGIIEEVCSPNPPFSAMQRVHVNYMSTHVSAYKMLSAHPEWVNGIRQMERGITGLKYSYIPKSAVKNNRLLRQTIHDGDVLVMITSKKGLDTSHLGIALWQKDGIHLLHASSVHKKVVIEKKRLQDYQKVQTSQIGIRVVRMK